MKWQIFSFIIVFTCLKAHSFTCSEVLFQNQRIGSFTENRLLNVPISEINYDFQSLHGSYFETDISYPFEELSNIVGVIFESDFIEREVHNYVYPIHTSENIIASGKLVSVRPGQLMFLIQRLSYGKEDHKTDEQGNSNVFYISNPR